MGHAVGRFNCNRCFKFPLRVRRSSLHLSQHSQEAVIERVAGLGCKRAGEQLIGLVKISTPEVNAAKQKQCTSEAGVKSKRAIKRRNGMAIIVSGDVS